MPDFDFSTLITDRSPADLELLRDMLATPLEDWTAEQLAEFNLARSKGAYNYTDLNRVTQCMDYLAQKLTDMGYDTGYEKVIVQSERADPYVWYEEDVPTLSQMTQYLNNALSLWNLFYNSVFVDSMQGLTYEDANSIESALIEIQNTILRIEAALYRSGEPTFWSGSDPLPSAKSYMGHTWAELDAMNTIWPDWNSTTWYLLVYGNFER